MSPAAVNRSAAGGPAAVNRSAAGSPVARRTADQRQPKYLRIYAELRDRITSGQWPAGSPLPPQRDLAGEFGVSIMTLRQALQLLTDDGLVAARHGSGTYVAARYEYDLGHLRSFAADLAAQGAEISTRLLATQVITPPAEVGARLGGPAQVLQLRRLRLAAGRPLIVQTSYLPLPLAGGLDPAGLARGGPVHGAGRARAGGHPRGGDHQPVCPGTARGRLSGPAGRQPGAAQPPGQLHRGRPGRGGRSRGAARRQRRDHRQPVRRPAGRALLPAHGALARAPGRPVARRLAQGAWRRPARRPGG